MWKQFYLYWIQIADSGRIPVYFIRFEDLKRHPEKVLKELMQFLLEVDSIEGTYIEKRIRDSFSKEMKSYKPREGEINRNSHLYS